MHIEDNSYYAISLAQQMVGQRTPNVMNYLVRDLGSAADQLRRSDICQLDARNGL